MNSHTGDPVQNVTPSWWRWWAALSARVALTVLGGAAGAAIVAMARSMLLISRGNAIVPGMIAMSGLLLAFYIYTKVWCCDGSGQTIPASPNEPVACPFCKQSMIPRSYGLLRTHMRPLPKHPSIRNQPTQR